jgi:hypothetical protein
MSGALAVIAGIALLIGAWDGVRRARSHRRDDADGARPRLDPALVPPHLRALIPLAEKWGIGDDGIRLQLIENASNSEKRALHDSLYETFEQISDWLNSFSGRPLSDEAAAFMYMQSALDEMGYHIVEEKKGHKA